MLLVWGLGERVQSRKELEVQPLRAQSLKAEVTYFSKD